MVLISPRAIAACWMTYARTVPESELCGHLRLRALSSTSRQGASDRIDFLDLCFHDFS
jgi:hypothetical protein